MGGNVSTLITVLMYNYCNMSAKWNLPSKLTIHQSLFPILVQPRLDYFITLWNRTKLQVEIQGCRMSELTDCQKDVSPKLRYDISRKVLHESKVKSNNWQKWKDWWVCKTLWLRLRTTGSTPTQVHMLVSSDCYKLFIVSVPRRTANASNYFGSHDWNVKTLPNRLLWGR